VRDGCCDSLLSEGSLGRNAGRRFRDTPRVFDGATIRARDLGASETFYRLVLAIIAAPAARRLGIGGTSE
jgi:hypothetical protein